MNDFFDNQRILNLIWKHRIHFVIVGIFAVVLSAIFSGPKFITPMFKSTARIYPTNIWVVSNESETEQMLEIVNSRDIKLRMFEAFNLDQVYKIKKDDPKYLTYMFDIYNKNVTAGKTQFETVEIKVMDSDPQRASDMCDSIISFYDQKVGELHRLLSAQMVDITGRELNKRYSELDSVLTVLDTLRQEYGILNYESQVPEITRGYMNALATGRGSAGDTKKIEELYRNFSEKGTKAIWTESRLNYLINTIDSLTVDYGFYTTEAEKEITYSLVVEYPVPADKKSYPVRWLIVFSSAFSAVFLSLLVFLVLDYRKKS